MPKTYLGYKNTGRGVIDWAGLTDQLGDDISQALNTRQLERQAFDEIETNNLDVINSYELGQSQGFNEYIVKGADNIRNQYYEWNKKAKSGEMTQSEYKLRTNNVMSDWDAFANAAKNFDKKHEEMLKRQQEGKGSSFEAELNKYNATLANLSDRSIYVNPATGRVYNARIGEDGEIVEALSAKQLQMPGNMLDDAMDLSTEVKAHVDNWGDWKKFEALGRGATRTTESKRLMEDYERLVETSIDTFVGDPRSVAKILVDNGHGEFYWNEDGSDRDAKIKAKVDREKTIRKRLGTLSDFDEAEFRAELENNYIFIDQDETGVFQPVVTDAQIDMARDRVRAEIDKTTGVEISGTKGFAPTSGESNGDAQGGNEEFSTYAMMEKDWRSGNFAHLEAENPNMKFKPQKGKTPDGRGFYKINIYNWDKESDGWEFITSARSAEDMLRYYFKPYKGLSAEQQYYQEQKAYQSGSQSQGKPKAY